MSKGAMDMVAEAKSNVGNLTPDEVAAELESGDALLVDLREPQERETASIPGSISAPRGSPIQRFPLRPPASAQGGVASQ